MDAGLRELVRERAAHCCEYCRLPQEFSELRFHVEHVIPRQHGGNDWLENLALACPACNLRKGPNLAGLDPKTGELVRLFHPRREKWSDHFAPDSIRVIGTTNVGRTTVHLLDMNDIDRTRVREGLRAIGQWL